MDEDSGEDELEPATGLSPPDPRAHAAWQAWLRALATDPDATFAAALAYDSLDPAGRDAWLAALESDADHAGVPRIAVYAPLLSVEDDEGRLDRIRAALGDHAAIAEEPAAARALRGVAPDQTRVVVLVLPLYGAFVQVLSFRYHEAEGFRWAKRLPFTKSGDAPSAGDEVDGVTLERTPMTPVVEELAHAVLAQRRRGEPPPEELRAVIDLFSPGSWD